MHVQTQFSSFVYPCWVYVYTKKKVIFVMLYQYAMTLIQIIIMVLLQKKKMRTLDAYLETPNANGNAG